MPKEKNAPLEKSLLFAPITGIIILVLTEIIVRDIIQPPARKEWIMATGAILEWAVLFFILFFWIPKREKKRLSSLGFTRFRFRYLISGTLVYLIGSSFKRIFGWTVSALNLEFFRHSSDLIRDYSVPLLILFYITGTFYEEIVYRGYFLSRFEKLTGKKWPGIVLGTLLFGLAHYFLLGPATSVNAMVFSLLMVLLFYREKSLWPLFVAHGLNDFLSLFRLIGR